MIALEEALKFYLADSTSMIASVIARTGVRQPMQISWKRGFLRGWVVLSLFWILFTGWYEYPTNGFSALLAAPSWRVDDDCWKQIAKWPDGKPFGEWDEALDEFDIPSNVEINQKKS